MPDYYADLNVNKDASAKEIKKSFRKLAQKHHPDRGGQEADFKKINEAYETLGDTNKKIQYDQQRQFQQSGFRPRQHAGPPGFSQTSPGQFEFTFGTGQPGGIEEVFSTVFGQGFGQQRPTVNRNISLEYEISLDDAYIGVEQQLDINLPSGSVRSVNVKIPPGIMDGSKLKFAGLGDNTNPSLPPGDLVIVIRVKNSSKWHRKNDDLITTIKVNVFDAILGCEVKFRHIDKKYISVKIPSGTQPNAKIRLKEKGIISTRTGQYGNLILLVDVIIPTDLTQKQLDVLSTIRELR
jgi:curved DNA-binding protein